MWKFRSNATSSVPLIVAFEDLSEAQCASLADEFAVCAAPTRSRADPHRWLVGFNTGRIARPVLYSSIARWARSAGLPPPRRVT